MLPMWISKISLVVRAMPTSQHFTSNWLTDYSADKSAAPSDKSSIQTTANEVEEATTNRVEEATTDGVEEGRSPWIKFAFMLIWFFLYCLVLRGYLTMKSSCIIFASVVIIAGFVVWPRIVWRNFNQRSSMSEEVEEEGEGRPQAPPFSPCI